MNYLAHAFLSNNNKDLLVGNFIADHVRGNNFDIFSPAIISGIRLHRQIDSFTDSHPLFKASKRFFYDGFEKHSGILVDIYFDHILASHFSKYSKVSLNEFSDHVYHVYSEYKHLFPKTSSGFLEYVINNNIYSAYADINEIRKVLLHLSARIRHGIQLDDSVPLFLKHEEEIKANFAEFFTDIKASLK